MNYRYSDLVLLSLLDMRFPNEIMLSQIIYKSFRPQVLLHVYLKRLWELVTCEFRSLNLIKNIFFSL